MPFFRKKPGRVEAWQWDGTPDGYIANIPMLLEKTQPHCHMRWHKGVDGHGAPVLVTPEAKDGFMMEATEWIVFDAAGLCYVVSDEALMRQYEREPE